jgi:hypothetical protein
MSGDVQRAIAQRFNQVLALGRVENASAWGTAAGLNRAYVSAVLEKVRKGSIGDIGVVNLYALARAAKVSPAWLAYGIGQPDDEVPDLVLTFPENLQTLLRRIPPGTYPDALLRQAVMVLEITGETDLSEDTWRDYLDSLRKEARRVGLEMASLRLENRGVKR